MWLEQGKRTLRTLAAVAGIVSAVACGGNGYGGGSPTAPNPPSGGGAGTADVTITIKGMLGAQSFDPNPASVKVGQTVAWTNADSTAHTATGTGFDTGTISPGQTSAPIPFTTAARVDYHCSIHPDMVGTLNVQ
jgi:plastocyanin